MDLQNSHDSLIICKWVEKVGGLAAPDFFQIMFCEMIDSHSNY